MRLFIGIRPPLEVVETIVALPRPTVAGLRWTTPDQWHVTLRFLGSVDDPAPLLDRLAATPVPLPAEVRLGPAVARFGQRVLHVEAAGVEPLAAAIAAATADIGRPPPPGPFVGHLTLARVANRARVDLRPLCGTPVAAIWTASRYTLEISDLRPDGARYRALAGFPAAGTGSGSGADETAPEQVEHRDGRQ